MSVHLIIKRRHLRACFHPHSEQQQLHLVSGRQIKGLTFKLHPGNCRPLVDFSLVKPFPSSFRWTEVLCGFDSPKRRT